MFYTHTLKKTLIKKNIRHIDGVILLRQEDFNLSYFLENISYFSPTIYVGDDYYGEYFFNYYGVSYEKVSSKIIDETIKLNFQLYNEEVASCSILLQDKRLAFFSADNLFDDYSSFLSSHFDFRLDYARIYHEKDAVYNNLICDNVLYNVQHELSFNL